MKRCYIPKTFYRKTADLLAECDAIGTAYFEKGYTLTLRQLFYQLVSTNRIENTDRAYKNLGNLVTEGRYAGVLDWEHITDRVRVLKQTPRWQDIEDYLTSEAAVQFNIDTWPLQHYRVEVWIEKDALIELAAEACNPFDVPFVAIKAYNSTSAMWEARKRFREYVSDGQLPLILHLGDHDYSGDDCPRFLQEHMELLTGSPVELRRLGLNLDQIAKYELPPQKGKQSDPRFKAYFAKYKTRNVWELDALAPDVIVKIITDGITDAMDADLRQVFVAIGAEGRETLKSVSDNWDHVKWSISTKDYFDGWLKGESR